MSHLGITKDDKDRLRGQLLKRLRLHSSLFIAALLLTPLVYALFAFGLLQSTPASDKKALEQAVALVATSTGTGTAFLVSPNQLLTARHVVENLNVGETVALTFERVKPSITLNAKLIWKEETGAANPGLEYFLTDLALLEVDNPDAIASITPLVLGDSDPVRTLDKVILLGYPGSDFSASEGTINNEKFNGLDLFKLDATANPGNSGGPCILESDYTVVGMLVGKKNVTESENVANKVNNIKGLLEKGGVSVQ